MAIAMKPCDPRLQPLMTLSTKVNDMMFETEKFADLPFVEGIRMLGDKAQKYIEKIFNNKGIVSQKQKGGGLTEEERNATILKNMEFQLRAEKLMEIAEPAFQTWKAQMAPAE